MSGKNVSYILFDRAPYRELLHDLSIKSPRNVVRDLRGGINRLNPTACSVYNKPLYIVKLLQEYLNNYKPSFQS